MSKMSSERRARPELARGIKWNEREGTWRWENRQNVFVNVNEYIRPLAIVLKRADS